MTQNWYALYVKTGREDAIKKILSNTIPEDQLHFLAPKRELRERRAGQWHTLQRTLFPGYILAVGNITTAIYYQIKTSPTAAKILKIDQQPAQINHSEIQTLKKLINYQKDIIKVSQAYQENDIITIINGPLKGLEGSIDSINKRKSRAKVHLNFLGTSKTVQLGLEIIQKL